MNYAASSNAAASKLRCKCGREKQPQYQVCWRCKSALDIQHAYQRGYHNGSSEARQEAQHTLSNVAASSIALSEFDLSRIRQLIQLCHPDKHAGSVGAIDATAWLLKFKALLEAKGLKA